MNRFEEAIYIINQHNEKLQKNNERIHELNNELHEINLNMAEVANSLKGEENGKN